jgi:hypothetical protein
MDFPHYISSFINDLKFIDYFVYFCLNANR